jgi:hypothetical protein
MRSSEEVGQTGPSTAADFNTVRLAMIIAHLEHFPSYLAAQIFDLIESATPPITNNFDAQATLF